MLTRIYIKNFVIVDELSLEFSPHLNVLTGETGAGKSIWVDAVMLALGARLDNNPVRENQQQCNITLCFDLSSQPAATAWLQDHQFELTDECIISRSINHEGKSRSNINGQPCTQSMIKDFASLLILTHSQHQHQALLKRQMQRTQLDAFSQLSDKTRQLNTFFQQWQQLQHQIQQLQNSKPNKDNELQLLRYQLDEIEELQLKPGEWQQLSDEHQRCCNAQNLISSINTALELTTQNEQHNAAQLVQQALSQLQHASCDDSALTEAKEMLNTAAIHLEEAGANLNSYRNSLDLSPERLQDLEDRIQRIHDIARKHHCPAEQLGDIQSSLAQQISSLENSDIHLETLLQTEQNLVKQYNTLAKKISRTRQKNSAILSEKVTSLMHQLGMEGGKFHIELTPLDTPINAHGQEQIDFQVSTNQGQALQNLGQVVSGGELSRISLALQVITAEYCRPPTLIFDEVDVGIGGKTADTVGELLHALGENQQVLCITHLAQIAAKGQRHFQISKQLQDNATLSQVMQLKDDERIQEIARMLGGESSTSEAHAAHLLQCDTVS